MPFPSWTAEEFTKLELPHPKWVLTGLIPGDGWTLLVAKPKTGKSILMLQTLQALTLGQGFLGGVPPGALKCLYIQGDAPAGSFQSQIQQIAPLGKFGITMVPHGILDSLESRATTLETIKSWSPDFLVWDALEKLTFLDLNTKEGCQPTVERLKGLSLGKPFLIIHHPRKGNPDGSVEDFRNASAGNHYLTGDADCIMGLEWRSLAKEGSLTVITRQDEDKKLILGRGPVGQWFLKGKAEGGPKAPSGASVTSLYDLPA